MAQCEEWEKQLRAEEEGKDFQANIAEKAKQAALEEEKRGDEKRKKDRAEAAKRMTTTAIARKAALATDAEASNNGEGSSRAQEQRTHTNNAESRKGFEPKKQLSQMELNERRRTFKETVDAASKVNAGTLTGISTETTVRALRLRYFAVIVPSIGLVPRGTTIHTISIS